MENFFSIVKILIFILFLPNIFYSPTKSHTYSQSDNEVLQENINNQCYENGKNRNSRMCKG